jgi:hypothetical protein
MSSNINEYAVMLWHVIQIISKAKWLTLRKHSGTVCFCLLDCWLEVNMYLEGPMTGHLDTSILVSFSLHANVDIVLTFQAVPAFFSWRSSDLNTSKLNLLLWVQSNYLSNSLNSPLIRKSKSRGPYLKTLLFSTKVFTLFIRAAHTDWEPSNKDMFSLPT